MRALVNPATANDGGPNADLVAENIRPSFRAFRDTNIAATTAWATATGQPTITTAATTSLNGLHSP